MTIQSHCGPTDVDALLVQLREVSVSRDMGIAELGRVGDDPLVLVTPSPASRGPQILVAAGFHGEEPAGCWGLLQFLTDAPIDLLLQIRLSLLPVVNPTGIRKGERFNLWGENPNKGFCHPAPGRPEASHEGKLLLNNLPRLVDCARDGFLSLHEDVELEKFYLYTFENRSEPGPFTKMLVDTEARFFESVPDGPLEGAIMVGGVAFRHCDGSFEDRLFHEGVPRTACTETPGLLSFDRRVVANTALAEAFCRFHASGLQ